MRFKKMASTAMILAMATGLAACSSNNNSGPAESGAAATTEPATSTSAPANVELRVLTDGSIGIGEGVVSDLLPKKKEALIADETLAPRVTEADFTYTQGQAVSNPNVFGYFYQDIINENLKAENITVSVEDWGWGDTLTQKETAAFLAGNVPDIIVGETQMPGFAQQGQLEPFPDDMAAEIREKLAPAAWKPMEYDGKIYGLAAQPGVSSLFWNKALVKEAGIDPDKAPATWDEWLADLKKVNEAGKGKFYGGGVYAGPNAGGYLRYGPLLLINNGGFADDQGQPVFNSEANVKTVEFLKELNAVHPAGLMANQSEGAYFDAFKKGQIAYLIDGPWRAGESATLGIDYGMATIPLSADGKASNITIGAAFNSVPTGSKNKEAAFEYIRQMYSEEIQNLIADTGTRSPVLKSVAETDTYKQDHPEMYQHYLAMSGDVQGLPTFAKSDAQVWQFFGDAVTKALMTDGDIKGILDDAQAKAEKLTK
ncbi:MULTISPECIES: extracellular solute-binding protein [Paenibacillus]|uniref:sugar ABC transporter substrate-binding protein n=1 Tax=Paenibacillus TaxID=44249 RepID=UPI0009D76C77|nr:MULTISPECIES: extracellular solute-binding protein [Paenibacillus]